MPGGEEVRNGRAFREIDVSLCSAVSGKTRFPPVDWGLSPTPVRYRNNLTALSQYYNLYIIAVNYCLHVYQPQFPSQKLSSNPDLQIELPISRHGLPGYISHEQPHAVNQLIVGDLGNEELVVCVCDDGDVIAYTTRSFIHTIREKANWTDLEHPPSPDIKPFFQRNVGLSAWGVAIHKRARVIAVSSNTHQITVFAFGLKNIEDADTRWASDSDIEIDEEWYSKRNEDDLQSLHVQADDTQYGMMDRTKGDIEFTLDGHSTNIPNIAFCGSDTDPAGKYLASIDIDGEVCIWDVWARRLIRSHPSTERHPISLYSRITLGWSILCLEPQFFRLTKSAEECCGYKSLQKKVIWDISESRHEIRNNSTVREGSLLDSEMTFLEEDDDEDEGSEDAEDLADRASQVFEEGFSNLEQRGINQYALDVALAQGASGSHFTVMDFTAENLHENQQQEHRFGEERGVISHEIPAREIPRADPNYPQSLHFSILHTSLHNIYLRQEPTGPVTVKMDDALDQYYPPSFDPLGWSDRLNMTAQIPELGVVVVASQVGRAALITLTRVRLKGGKYKHAFRVDWILPFKSEEDEGLRPNVPLAGIAVGPIQGREFQSNRSNDSSPPRRSSHRATGSSRRYRLMLTYLDNTVLSYEIGRPMSGNGDNGTSDNVSVF